MIEFSSAMFEDDISDDDLAVAIAEVFGVQRVSVYSETIRATDDAEIYVERLNQPGAFPFGTYILIDSPENLDHVPETEKLAKLQRLAARLNRLILTDSVGVSFPDDFLLITPNGEYVVLEADAEVLAHGRLEFVPKSYTKLLELKQHATAIPA